MKQNIEIEVPEGYKAVYNPDTKNVDIVKIVVATKPKSWEEFCDNNPIKDGEAFITLNSSISNSSFNVQRHSLVDRNVCTSKEEAGAFLALMQLRQLRKAWVGDWEPNWDKNNTVPKYTIEVAHGDIIVDTWASRERALSFPTKEMAKEFIDAFKPLIKTAERLFM